MLYWSPWLCAECVCLFHPGLAHIVPLVRSLFWCLLFMRTLRTSVHSAIHPSIHSSIRPSIFIIIIINNNKIYNGLLVGVDRMST